MKFSEEEKAKWLAGWQKSGKSAPAYAQENGLIPQTFCNWVKRQAEEASGFVEIPAQKRTGAETQPEVLVEKGDITIRIPLSVWLAYPGAILEGLKAAP